MNKNFFLGPSFNKELENNLETLLKKIKIKIAGIIVEPLVQCAGGMKIYPPKVLNKIYQLKNLILY